MSHTPPVPLLLTSDRFNSPEEEIVYLRTVAEYLRDHIDQLHSPNRYQAVKRFEYEAIRIMNPVP